MDTSLGVVQVRLVAATPAALDEARVALVAALGEQVQFTQPARPGRRGEWLLYGRLHIQSGAARTGEPPPVDRRVEH